MIRILILSFGLTAILVLINSRIFPPSREVTDAKGYISLVEGRTEEVSRAHARKAFHPWLVKLLRPWFKTDQAFFLIGVLSIFLFLTHVFIILNRHFKIPISFCLGYVCLPYLFGLYHYFYIPILFFTALSSVYWILLLRGNYFLSLIPLFLLFLTRDESTVIALAVIVGALWGARNEPHKRKTYLLYAALALILRGVTFIALDFMTRDYVGMHDLPSLMFLIFRMPFYLLRNLLGVELWIDAYQNLPFYTHPPMLSFNAPDWIRVLSTINDLGIYRWNFLNILYTLLLILLPFGTAPTLLAFFLKKKFSEILISSTAFKILLFSGVSLFILAPLQGPPYLRYYLSSWPVFLIVVPAFLEGVRNATPGLFSKLICLYVLCGWLFAFYPFSRHAGLVSLSALGLAGLAFHASTWHLLDSSLANKKQVHPISLRS